MTVALQAEYEKVPGLTENGMPVAHLRSFKDINNDYADDSRVSQDSGVAAIELVLNASPSWLTSPTKVGSQSCHTPGRLPYALRGQTGSSPAKRETTNFRTLKVDETKHQDPTYQPSEAENPSESSDSTECNVSKLIKKTRVDATARQALQHHNHVTQGHNIYSPRTATMSTGGRRARNLSTVMPALISSTPIPAPSINDLLQKIRHTVSPSHSQAALNAREVAKSPLEPKTPNHYQNVVGPKNFSLAPITLTAMLATTSEKNVNDTDPRPDSKTRKRKRRDDRDVDTKISGHIPKKQKRQRSLKKHRLLEKRKDRARKAEGGEQSYRNKDIDGRQGKPNTPSQSRDNMLDKCIVETSHSAHGRASTTFNFEQHIQTPSDVAGHPHTVNPQAPPTGNDVTAARRYSGRTKKVQNQKRRLFSLGVDVNSKAVMAAPEYPALAQISLGTMQNFKRKAMELRPSLYDHSPTLPVLTVKPEPPEEYDATSLDQSLGVLTRKSGSKEAKNNNSRAARKKLLSPPITSRPSSAGSKM
ncbi:hypothetical protein BKA67DRAFT_582294 [Truncatella angustata]|uniref:Uncharacterized protein n=1 Tax=Truncatella angustata TaxID=152316 RepID=A0A9P8UCG3_9PEZI|nr:uncharacterized protein BKA67DRAFT_582294 [Truncatella angustata]KAH6645757.1 hypothetical protein BKA67DRAFT_582294 [Truncatella angustata]